MRRFVVIAGVFFFVLTGAVVLVAFGARDFDIVREAAREPTSLVREEPGEPLELVLPESPLTGLPCKYAGRRPLAVMLAADPITRPLSGISDADVVIEMPVTSNQVTRLMALYQCAQPKELGSIRSARHDFLPLAAGFDAIYSHWGGSHFALEKLAAGALDKIDALINPHDAYFRKRGIPGPHNGFTSYERLWQAAGKLGYRLTLGSSLRAPQGRGEPDEIAASPSPFSETKVMGPRNDKGTAALDSARTVNVNYNPNGFAVRWEYHSARQVYQRSRAGKPEMDRNTNTQVEASVVIVMETTQTFLEGQYTDVRVIGSGTATIYQNGGAFSGRWEKQDFTASLKFFDASGEEMTIVPGKKWIEIIVK